MALSTAAHLIESQSDGIGIAIILTGAQRLFVPMTMLTACHCVVPLILVARKLGCALTHLLVSDGM